MRIARLAFAALAPLLGVAGAATAAPQSHAPSINAPRTEPCFEVGRVSRTHGDGDKALIVRTDEDRYYRIGFAAQCPNVMRPDSAVVLKARGSSTQICHPIDLMVTVTASRFPMNCAVDAIHPMTAAEVAALPAKNRP